MPDVSDPCILRGPQISALHHGKPGFHSRSAQPAPQFTHPRTSENESLLVFNASHELINEIEVAISSAKMVEPATLGIIAGVKHLIRKLTAAEKVSKPVSSDRLTTDRKSTIP